MIKKFHEIGSEYNLSLNLLYSADKTNIEEYFSLKGDQFILLSGGRVAIKYCLKHCLTIDSSKTFLLPSYLCHTVIQPFRELGLKFKFYKVAENLKVDLNYLKSVISPDIEGILFIHYFGFKQESEFLELIMDLRDKGVKVIEDLSQALLTENIGQYGDYSLTSFRKFIPVPDGGYLKSNYHKISRTDLKQGYNEFWGRRLLGLIYKDLYISNNIGKKDFFLINFSEAEKAYDTHIEITSISDYSRKIIRKFDFQNIKKQRRINFQFLLERLKHVPGISLPYDHLPENVCPAGFPIITQKRDLLKEKFITRKIYPPIHWLTPEEVDKSIFRDSYWLSNHILTIPCDQRYKTSDMEKILEVL